MPSSVSYTVSLLAPRPARHLYSFIFTLTPFSPSPRKASFIFPLLSYIFYLPYDRIWY